MTDPLDRDVAAIQRITAVPTILQVIAQSTGFGCTVISRITESRWVACAVRDDIACGLRAGTELDAARTLCKEVRDTRAPVVIEHASEDPVYHEHPAPREAGFESYIGVPIYRADGTYFGNVCGFSRTPLQLHGTHAVTLMTLFAELISLQLRVEEEHARDSAALAEARHSAELREQFIAVLGHDLRSPLAAIASAAEVLGQPEMPEPVRAVAQRVRRSRERMQLLIDDVLDFARGRLGGGFPLTLRPEPDVVLYLRHVIDEIASQHRGQQIHLSVHGQGELQCDRSRLEQVLSNLLSNAIQHGSNAAPIEVVLEFSDDAFELSVRNQGAPVPQGVIERLFHPFYRGASGKRGGLGLGLYIVAEVARAHGGSANVTSSAAGDTCFTVRVPRTSPGGNAHPTPAPERTLTLH